MPKNSAQFNYEHFNNALAQLNALTEAAETHGIMCGFICAGVSIQNMNWLDPILAADAEEDVLSTPSGVLLRSLFNHTYQQLQSFEFDLYLLLPDDETPLKERSEA